MATLFAQGDLLIERVHHTPREDKRIETGDEVVLAEGELTGHFHKIRDNVTFYRDDALARDVPSDLYIGHVVVEGPSAELRHPEHGAITLVQGIWRVRRQRQLDPREARIVSD